MLSPLVSALALLVAAPAPRLSLDPRVGLQTTEPDAVPVQRPDTIAPNQDSPTAEEPDAPVEPDVPAEAEPEAPVTPATEPAPPPASETAPAPPPVATANVHATGTIEGVLTDAEIEGVPLSGVMVTIQCSCLDETLVEVTDSKGHFIAEDLPPGVHTITADRGGPPTQRVAALSPGEAVQVDFEVAPPTTTETLDRRREEEQSARTLLAAGGLLAIGGALLLIATGVENAKRECLFDQDDCAAAPRPGLTRGLGVTGGLLMAGGAAMVTVGIVRKRRLKARIAIEDQAASLVLSGRF